MYADEVYAKGRELLETRIADGTYVSDESPCFYLYELVMDGRSQVGIVACCVVDDYLGGTIKKHENTLEKKERDRIRHIDALDAQTGPIFLTYRDNASVDELVARARTHDPLYDFVAEDGIAHRVWAMARHRRRRRARRRVFGRACRLYRRRASSCRFGGEGGAEASAGSIPTTRRRRDLIASSRSYSPQASLPFCRTTASCVI